MSTVSKSTLSATSYLFTSMFVSLESEFADSEYLQNATFPKKFALKDLWYHRQVTNLHKTQVKYRIEGK